MFILALLLPLLMSIMIGNKVINAISNIYTLGQPTRISTLDSHISKKGTPSLGALIIIISFLASFMIFIGNLSGYYGIILFTTLSFAIIGFLDDHNKLKNQKNFGIKGKTKIFISLLISIVSLYLVSNIADNFTCVFIPIINQKIDLGIFYWPFALFILIGTANAVNITDGLDGLATLISVSVLFTLFIVNSINPFNIDLLDHDINMMIIIMIGSCLGFLWFNIYPAKIFMGDTGSLSLGSFIAIITIITKNEIFLAISAIIFIIETLSVIIQVLTRKLTRKFCDKELYIFKIAPIHHHFEKMGYHEVTITTRFTIISLIIQMIIIFIVQFAQ